MSHPPQAALLSSSKCVVHESRIVAGFQGKKDGGCPHGALTSVNGLLYGTTSIGGPLRKRPLFCVDPGTAAEAVLYGFAGGADGGFPVAGVTYSNGLFYGTTTMGGMPTDGAAFSIDPVGGAETTLYDFDTAGATSSGLTVHRARFFGTTVDATSKKCKHKHCGAVFSLRP